MAWTEEQKQEAIDSYMAGEPTPENSTELIKQIAEDMEQSPNGVRQVLVQAKVYVKKDAAADKPATKTTTTKTGGDAAKRPSKESQMAELRAAIEKAGGSVDEEIISKLTGKAAAYFTTVLTTK